MVMAMSQVIEPGSTLNFGGPYCALVNGVIREKLSGWGWIPGS